MTVGLAEGARLKGLVVVRLGADDGDATGCEPLGDGCVMAAEGDPAAREGVLPVGDGEGVGVAKDDGARLGRGWTGV